MNPLERLLLEAIPTRPDPAVHSQWTTEEQDQHWEDLADAIGVPSRKRPEHRPAGTDPEPPEPSETAA